MTGKALCVRIPTQLAIKHAMILDAHNLNTALQAIQQARLWMQKSVTRDSQPCGWACEGLTCTRDLQLLTVSELQL